MGIAGMLLGITAIVFLVVAIWAPLFGIVVSLISILAGLPLSAVALAQGRSRGTGVGMAIAGLVTTLVALLFFILAIIIVIAIGIALINVFS